MLLVDSVAMLLVVYWSLRNDRLTPGNPEEGWFRIGDPQAKPARKASTKIQAPPQRRSHW